MKKKNILLIGSTVIIHAGTTAQTKYASNTTESKLLVTTDSTATSSSKADVSAKLTQTGKDGSLYLDRKTFAKGIIQGYEKADLKSKVAIIIADSSYTDKIAQPQFGILYKLTPTDKIQLRIDEVEKDFISVDVYQGGEQKGIVYFKKEDIITK